MAIEYNFKYMPLVGKLSGESMVQQTETAINEIAKIVNDNTAQAEIINTLAEQANANSVEALEKANEALDTSGRVYIKETLAVNLNNYCESQLIYINNVASQNLPIAHKGFLEVKTNDDKTQATQVFTDDVDRKFYVRTGAITATTVGDVTTYTASYGAWVDIPNITDLDNYLALAGGTMSGDIQFSASEWKIKGSDIDNDAKLSIVGATDNLNGSSLNLYGRNHTESGAFELNANNGTYTKTLKGTATGNLTWDGNVTADNFVGDVTGNLSGNVTGNVTGDVTGNVSGNVTGDVTGDVTGNVIGNADTATNATNDGNGNNIANTYLPAVVGAVVAFAGSTSPTGWLLCDGSAVSRTDYAALFAVIGTTYGTGDGSTTFNLPNLVDKFVEGSATAGTEHSAGLPNITGDLLGTNGEWFFKSKTQISPNGVLYSTSSLQTDWAGNTNDSGYTNYSLLIDASRSSSIYGNSTTVQPPALTMRYIIKY